jgi:hypothetical protein
MATTQEIDAALAELRAARLRLFQASQEREQIALRRQRLTVSLAQADAAITTARSAMLIARQKVQDLLAQTEANPPAPTPPAPPAPTPPAPTPPTPTPPV